MWVSFDGMGCNERKEGSKLLEKEKKKKNETGRATVARVRANRGEKKYGSIVGKGSNQG